MKRAALICLAALLISGCAATPAPETTTGAVILKAKMTQYQPDPGTACEPAGTASLSLITSEDTYRVPLETGSVFYPSGKESPGDQWCKIPFTVTIATKDRTLAAQIGSASVFVPAEKLPGVQLMMVAGSLVVI